MPKKANSSTPKKTTTTKKNTTPKKKTTSSRSLSRASIEYEERKKRYKRQKLNNLLSIIVLFFFGVLLIFSTYAWLSTALNVKIRNFQMTVSQNSGLSISLDGITFSSYVDISKEILIDELQATYPNNTSQWAGSGLIPVSSSGIINSNSPIFTIYASGGVRYKGRSKQNGFVTTQVSDEVGRTEYNRYIAFDIFLKNQTGSPVSDNLYINQLSYVEMRIDAPTEEDEEGNMYVPTKSYDDDNSDGLHQTEDENAMEMRGLLNSLRIGFLKIGTVSTKASVEEIQNIQCNNRCEDVIYEPHSTEHTELSIQRAAKFGVTLIDGERFPTYSYKKAGGPIYIKNAISGSPYLDYEYFTYQETIKEEDFLNPIFELPDGITKMRIYIWIEGQDIDSLETNSHGAEIALSIDLAKDTHGYTSFN